MRLTWKRSRVSEGAHGGLQCLKLEIKPKDLAKPPAALERTYLALHSPAVHLVPGSLVKISGWARLENGIAASADGALMFDSAGGEPLAIRLFKPWKKSREFTWYRRVPESGKVNLTLAMTGIGTVYFDDLKIEPLQPGAEMPPEEERHLRIRRNPNTIPWTRTKRTRTRIIPRRIHPRVRPPRAPTNLRRKVSN